MKIEKGMKFQAAADSETPEMIITVVETGKKDADGLNAVEIEYSDGSREIAAIAMLQEAVETMGLRVIG